MHWWHLRDGDGFYRLESLGKQKILAKITFVLAKLCVVIKNLSKWANEIHRNNGFMFSKHTYSVSKFVNTCPKSNIFPAQTLDYSKNWLTKVGRKQVKMGRFVLEASQSAAVDGIKGLHRWELDSTRIDKLFLTYARRFEWSSGNWGEAVWRPAKMQAVTTSWWKRTQDKCQYYEIDFEKKCTGFSSWRKYVHFCIERKAKEDWLLRVRMKCSLQFLTIDGEKEFGRRAPLCGSCESIMP